MAVASNLIVQEHNLVSVLLLEWGKKYMCVCGFCYRWKIVESSLSWRMLKGMELSM